MSLCSLSAASRPFKCGTPFLAGVVMVHKFFSYAPCINNKNCLMHFSNYLGSAPKI
jgi:hypothetical protein